MSTLLQWTNSPYRSSGRRKRTFFKRFFCRTGGRRNDRHHRHGRQEEGGQTSRRPGRSRGAGRRRRFCRRRRRRWRRVRPERSRRCPRRQSGRRAGSGRSVVADRWRPHFAAATFRCGETDAQSVDRLSAGAVRRRPCVQSHQGTFSIWKKDSECKLEISSYSHSGTVLDLLVFHRDTFIAGFYAFISNIEPFMIEPLTQKFEGRRT